MSSLGPLPPLFPQQTHHGSAELEKPPSEPGPSSGFDEHGRPLKSPSDVIALLPGLAAVIKSPTYLGVHTIMPGELIQVDQNPSDGSNLQLELTGEVLRDGSNTLCLHMTSVLPPVMSKAGAGDRPGSSRRSRPAPLSMDDLLKGVGSLGTTGAPQEPSGNPEPSPSGGPSSAPPEAQAQQCVKDAIMITGQVHRISPGATVPAPHQSLPGCFRTHFIGPYRVRLLSLELQDPVSSATTPGYASPDSTLPEYSRARSGLTASVGGGLEDLAQPTVLAHVAADRVQNQLLWRRPHGSQSSSSPEEQQEPSNEGIRCLHLEAGESCTLWLTTQSKTLQQVSFGPAFNGFTVALHSSPLPRHPAAPDASAMLLLDPDEADNLGASSDAPPVPSEGGIAAPAGDEQAAGPSSACSKEDEEGHGCWEAELDMLRCGEVEATRTIRLSGGAKSSAATPGEELSATVGDYRVTVLRQAAPMCPDRESSGDEEGIYCEYPMLLMHAEVRVERLSEEETEDAAGGGFGFLDAL